MAVSEGLILAAWQPVLAPEALAQIVHVTHRSFAQQANKQGRKLNLKSQLDILHRATMIYLTTLKLPGLFGIGFSPHQSSMSRTFSSGE